MSDLLADLLGHRPATVGPQAVGLVDGRVTRSTADGIWFVVDGWDTQLECGPAPVPAFLTAGGPVQPPAVGNLCVVCFVGTGVSRPRVLSWWAA